MSDPIAADALKIPIDLQLVANLPIININNDVVGVDSRFNQIFWVLYVAKLSEKLDRAPLFENIDEKANIRLSRVDGKVLCPAFMSSLVRDLDRLEKITSIDQGEERDSNANTTTLKKPLLLSPFFIILILSVFIAMIQLNFYLSRLPPSIAKVRAIQTAPYAAPAPAPAPAPAQLFTKLNQNFARQYPFAKT